MSKRSIVVLVSGGLDSCALLTTLSLRYGSVWPVYIRQGLKWESVELYWLKRFLRRMSSPAVSGGGRHTSGVRPQCVGSIKPLTVLDVPMKDVYGKHWSTGGSAVPGPRSRDSAVFLPGRNLVLSVKAAIFAAKRGIPQIAIGSLDHNPFPDATPQFFKSWSKALSMGLGGPVRVIAPYRKTEKFKLIERMRKWPLSLSFSCIAPKGKKHCGRCNKCVERIKAFTRAGVEDVTHYAAKLPRPPEGGRGLG